jgi:hypothetical protein
MKTTTTETFDKNGKIIKRITVTEDEQVLAPPTYPLPFYPGYLPPLVPLQPMPYIITDKSCINVTNY